MKVTRQWLDSPEPTTRDDERREIEHNAFTAGHSAGLREAVEAIKKIEGIPYKLGYEEKAWVERAEAIAAIRALVPHD